MAVYGGIIGKTKSSLSIFREIGENGMACRGARAACAKAANLALVQVNSVSGGGFSGGIASIVKMAMPSNSRSIYPAIRMREVAALISFSLN